jgi:hypothetical protein
MATTQHGPPRPTLILWLGQLCEDCGARRAQKLKATGDSGVCVWGKFQKRVVIPEVILYKVE